MEKQEIGRFYAVSYSTDIMTFIVFDDNTMFCTRYPNLVIKRMEIKPRFVLYGDDFKVTYDAKPVHFPERSNLICDYSFVEDEELFNYLKKNSMIRYSTDMAFLYGLPNLEGYDKKYVRSPYKRASKKGPILARQRNGYFNG